MINKFALLLLIVMGLASCKSSQSSKNKNNMAQLKQNTTTTWQLIGLSGEEIKAGDSQKPIQFTLDVNNRVYGFTGCNNFNGNFSLDDNYALSFSPLATTRMACPDVKVNEQEVLNIFNQTKFYTLEGDNLFLKNSQDNLLAKFKKIEQQEQIVEKYWKLKELNGKTIEMQPNQDKEIYFMLKTDENRLTGFGGCNTIGGSFELKTGQRIDFSNLLSTMRMCEGDISKIEKEFFKVFDTADNYSIKNDRLTLNVGRRAPLAVFEAVYF
ncbi:META domain-containing protein [Mesonia sp. HuA40]|uniref:META domain-containing protein n=1 Tax=Mesonia sp. HuA40 TaxID=2602761 RepID=UPI0011CC6E5F|nr:META domain-containing protein [Mesonia sp. HuA40]TXK73565.1 META domain-containing protein [Mesonia sp. HuA40]